MFPSLRMGWNCSLLRVIFPTKGFWVSSRPIEGGFKMSTFTRVTSLNCTVTVLQPISYKNKDEPYSEMDLF